MTHALLPNVDKFDLSIHFDRICHSPVYIKSPEDQIFALERQLAQAYTLHDDMRSRWAVIMIFYNEYGTYRVR